MAISQGCRVQPAPYRACGCRQHLFGSQFTSQSNQGIGPHEINPLFALGPIYSTTTRYKYRHLRRWYGANPSTRLEQANMEWMWLLAGRIDTATATPEVHDGRWGDASALWYHFNGAGARSVGSLPRPGRSGNLSVATSNVAFNFGGLDGFDDNQDTLEGIASRTDRSHSRLCAPVWISPVADAARSSWILASRSCIGLVAALPEQWGRYFDYPSWEITPACLTRQNTWAARMGPSVTRPSLGTT